MAHGCHEKNLNLDPMVSQPLRDSESAPADRLFPWLTGLNVLRVPILLAARRRDENKGFPWDPELPLISDISKNTNQRGSDGRIVLREPSMGRRFLNWHTGGLRLMR